jgi:hypothetical protein
MSSLMKSVNNEKSMKAACILVALLVSALARVSMHREGERGQVGYDSCGINILCAF